MVVKIGSLEAIHSKIDYYGNTYWAFTYTDYATKTKVNAKIGTSGESTIKSALYYWNGEFDYDAVEMFDFEVTELKIREFNRLIKEWPYAHDTHAKLAQYIRDRLPATQPMTDDALRKLLTSAGLTTDQVESAVIAARTPTPRPPLPAPPPPAPHVWSRSVTRIAN